MIKISIILLSVLVLTSCGGNVSAPVNDRDDAFTILSTSPDTGTNTVIINIRITGPLSQETARAAAETVIARNRDAYRNITVKSFTPGAKGSDLPYLTSTLQNGEINHKINPLAAPQKIPTH